MATRDDDWISELTRTLPPVLTTREALTIVRVCRRHFYRLVAEGRIHAVKPTTTGASKLLIPRASIERYLRSLEG